MSVKGEVLDSRDVLYTKEYEERVKKQKEQDLSVLKELLNNIYRKKEIHDVIIVEDQSPEVKENGEMRREPGIKRWTEGVYFQLLKLSKEISKDYEYLGDGKVIQIYDREIPRIVQKRVRNKKTGEIQLRNFKDTEETDKETRARYVEDLWGDIMGDANSYDFTSELKENVLRCHLSKVHPNKLSLTIRVAPKDIPQYHTLNLPKGLDNAVNNNSRGLVLISGAVSSGKTTTANSIIDVVNRENSTRKLIITAEEPIEYTHQDNSAKIIQRGVGKETPSFAQAARDALRETADIVYLGEIRTWEDMSNALQLSETGHLVLTTIHSNGVLDTVERFIMSAPHDIQDNIRARFNENLLGVAHLELIKVGTKRYPLVTQFFVESEASRDLFRQVDGREKLEKLFNQEGVFEYKQGIVNAFDHIENVIPGTDEERKDLEILRHNIEGSNRD